MDGFTDIPVQTLAAWAIVAATGLLLARYGWRKFRATGSSGKSGCGGGCGCPRSGGIPEKPEKKGL